MTPRPAGQAIMDDWMSIYFSDELGSSEGWAPTGLSAPGGEVIRATPCR